MAQKNYRVGEAIPLGYQAPNKETGLIVISEIYLPNKAKDSAFPDVTLDEIDGTGTYRGEFTPDQQGTWQVITAKDDGDGQVANNYSVGADNVHSVGGKIDTVDAKVEVVDAKVVAVASDLGDVEIKVDAIDTKVSALDTPPMAF